MEESRNSKNNLSTDLLMIYDACFGGVVIPKTSGSAALAVRVKLVEHP